MRRWARRNPEASTPSASLAAAASALAAALPAAKPEPTSVGPFKMCFGMNVHFMLYHIRHHDRMTLAVLQSLGGQQWALWRQIDAPLAGAAQAADRLVDDIYEYAFDLGAKVERPTEDLGPDDYIEHVRLTALGGFH